jgi:hypothetical protein
VPQAYDRGNLEDWDSGLENEFEVKLLVVAQWCEAYTRWCRPKERHAWLRFAAFLKILAEPPETPQ